MCQNIYFYYYFFYFFQENIEAETLKSSAAFKKKMEDVKGRLSKVSEKYTLFNIVIDHFQESFVSILFYYLRRFFLCYFKKKFEFESRGEISFLYNNHFFYILISLHQKIVIIIIFFFLFKQKSVCPL